MARRARPGWEQPRRGRKWRTALALAVLLIAGLAAVMAVNAWRMRAEPLATTLPPPPPVDPAAIARLAVALRIPTISTADAPPPAPALAAFHAHLAASFPRVHQTLSREVLAGGTLLYTWPGRDPAAPALLLAAHQDVVPIDPGSAARWTHPPFAGTVADGHVWGRGAIDDKASLMAILEAAERLAARGIRPRQTVYLAFGHDEERGGSGARAVAQLLRQRGARIGLALDEGYAVLDGVLSFVRAPVAVIGTAEKGYVSVELIARGTGGHSSMPGDDNAAARLSRAVDRIFDDQLPARLDGPAGALIDHVAPHADWPMRAVLANRWLTAPLIRRAFLARPDTAALLRTTTAPTILAAGSKDNVLPQTARAVINHRILPGDSRAGVLAHDRAAADDPGVMLRALPGGHEPSQPADPAGPDFQRLKAVVRSHFPNAVIAPGLVLGATDGRAYEGLARSVLRFMPIVMTRADLARFHGNDERLAVDQYMRAIAFYQALLAG